MRGYAIAAEKSLGQVWGELTKKGWSFRKSLGLSDDRDTSLMNYCRRQGWLEFGPLPPAAQAELTEPATAASKPAPKPRAAAKSTQVPLESAAAAVPRPPCAEAKPSSPVTTVATTSVSKKPATKPAAKKPSAKRCASKRPATASSGSEPARRKRAAVGKTKPTTAQDSVAVDAAPLYDGPSGPTQAVLAYAENPLAIFYFFLPKDLWRPIAAETNKHRLDSVDEVAQGMRPRALDKRLTTPSTTVLSVEEYRVKLRRKNSIQPHEIIRYIF
ncbi:hypothetical protein L915_06730 [Phytophthora nicotianae]|uniref:Uncharacterized protein n=1 Tax=Phytophthora nicotianae TaxID=4792 RepID=W2H1J1_PHYNI|nr:hypothetical protein L915_06730 [Phytophthora nicotianae]